MFAGILRKHPIQCTIIQHVFRTSRTFHNVPFHENLTPADDSEFNLEDFQHYTEAPDLKTLRETMGIMGPESDTSTQMKAYKPRPNHSMQSENLSQTDHFTMENVSTTPNFAQLCVARQPVVFVSRFSDPYLNLAIEDYIFNQMPLPIAQDNYNRLMFYVNFPCVVIGKNQNPWKEVNLPLLTNLGIPLVRRRSGGGTVVHDLGNVNYSFMTSKENFDRFSFADLVVEAVNSLASTLAKIMVNERGDIVTKERREKVSGCAYKLSKGKLYHHGTMLLNLKLEILKKLLHRDESQIGEVHSSAAVNSVKLHVTNLLIEKDEFIQAVSDMFQLRFGTVSELEKSNSHSRESEYDQTQLLGLQSSVDAYSDLQNGECPVFTIDESTPLPKEIIEVKNELMQWEWKYGATPKFQHVFHDHVKDIHVTIDVDKKALVSSVAVESRLTDVKESFQFLQGVLAIRYTGSNIAGFIVDDEISEWLGNAIDGTS